MLRGESHAPRDLAFTDAWAWRQPSEPGRNCEITPCEADGQAKSKDGDHENVGGGSCTTLGCKHDGRSSGGQADNGLSSEPPRLRAPHDMIIAQVAASR